MPMSARRCHRADLPRCWKRWRHARALPRSPSPVAYRVRYKWSSSPAGGRSDHRESSHSHAAADLRHRRRPPFHDECRPHPHDARRDAEDIPRRGRRTTRSSSPTSSRPPKPSSRSPRPRAVCSGRGPGLDDQGRTDRNAPSKRGPGTRSPADGTSYASWAPFRSGARRKPLVELGGRGRQKAQPAPHPTSWAPTGRPYASGEPATRHASSADYLATRRLADRPGRRPPHRRRAALPVSSSPGVRPVRTSMPIGSSAYISTSRARGALNAAYGYAPQTLTPTSPNQHITRPPTPGPLRVPPQPHPTSTGRARRTVSSTPAMNQPGPAGAPTASVHERQNRPNLTRRSPP